MGEMWGIHQLLLLLSYWAALAAAQGALMWYLEWMWKRDPTFNRVGLFKWVTIAGSVLSAVLFALVVLLVAVQ